MEVNKVLTYIKNQCENNKLAHVFLLETNDLNKCYYDVLETIKYLNCPCEYEINCSRKCNLCHQIDIGNLPSLIIVSPDGLNIKKNQVNELKKRLSCKPVYSKYNTYIIKYAEKLNASSANTMLKFLEEPEDYVIGFLITENKENVLNTIKSRCQIFSVNYEDNFFYKKNLPIINDYFNSIRDNKEFLLSNKNILLHNFSDRDSILIFFKSLFLLLEEDLILKINHKSNFNLEYITNKDEVYILKLINLVEKTLQKIKYNVNLELLLDSFYIELRRLDE